MTLFNRRSRRDLDAVITRQKARIEELKDRVAELESDEKSAVEQAKQRVKADMERLQGSLARARKKVVDAESERDSALARIAELDEKIVEWEAYGDDAELRLGRIPRELVEADMAQGRVSMPALADALGAFHTAVPEPTLPYDGTITTWWNTGDPKVQAALAADPVAAEAARRAQDDVIDMQRVKSWLDRDGVR